jgi:hypothetical protein
MEPNNGPEPAAFRDAAAIGSDTTIELLKNQRDRALFLERVKNMK